MFTLVDRILDQLPLDVFSDVELIHLIQNTDAARYNQVKRALADGEIIKIRRGLYCLAERYRRAPLNLHDVAQKIYGPSYVSFESALSFHQLIPEAVYGVTCASFKRSKEFKTSLGVFTYTQVPRPAFPVGIQRIEEGRAVFLMATPLKALADLVYTNRLDWLGLEPLVESLRIEREDLKFKLNDLAIIQEAYCHSLRVTRFLDGIKKDLEL